MLTQDDIPHRHGVNDKPGFICFQRVVPPAYMQDTTPFWRRSALMWDAESALDWANADCTDQAGNKPFQHCLVAFSADEARNIYYGGGTWSDEEIKEMGALNWV